jgi:endonuclease/exonuclease/phosphatase (EEP) superfamily protein YafD
MAEEHPALDIVNNGLPLLAIGLKVLLLVSLALRNRMLIIATVSLLAIGLAVLIPNLAGAASSAPENAERFLRVATFNVWDKGNIRAKEVESFFAEINADVIVSEEVGSRHEKLLVHLRRAYPQQAGEGGLGILSKHPVVDKGWLDGSHELCRLSPTGKWARVDVDGRKIDIVGVHMRRPFFPNLQKSGFDKLRRFMTTVTEPVIVAGDFNAAPWTQKLHAPLSTTGVKRLNTVKPSWPAQWRNLELLPILPIDNILVSKHLSKIDLRVGPRLGSDHLPVIADIALVE